MTRTIDAATLERWLAKQDAVLVDVREPAENRSARIDGAHLVPLGDVSLARLPTHTGKKLVIHCLKGGRGARACEKLLAQDPALEVYNLEGGIEAWAAAGLPVHKAGRSVLPLDRQVQLTIGAGILATTALALFVDPLFVLAAGIFGAGLVVAGLTGFCGLARVMARMPWNQ